MDVLNGKHGNYGFHIKETTCEDGSRVEFEDPIFVMVHDNSRDGLTPEELRKVAEASIHKPIYWNDIECFHWMFDFKVWDHWCEMVHEGLTGESIHDCMHINVSE